jgi:hypothetical protein
MTLKDQKPSGATARVAPTKNDKPFKCIYAKCPSSGFKTLGSKQRHEREQHGDDPKCRYCDYTAKRQYQMKQHVEADHRGQLGNTITAL